MRALVGVYESHLQRWALGICDFRNAKFPKKSGFWTIDDLISTSKSVERKRIEAKEASELQKLRFIERQQIRQIQSGEFDDSWLPAGIRMTEAERAARQKRR